jgi:hypothetical protein
MPRTLALKAARIAIVSLSVGDSFIIIHQTAQAAEVTLACAGRSNAMHRVQGPTSAGIPDTLIYTIDFDRSMAFDGATSSGRGYAAKISEQSIAWCRDRNSTDCVNIDRFTGNIVDEKREKGDVYFMRFSGTCKKSEGKRF